MMELGGSLMNNSMMLDILLIKILNQCGLTTDGVVRVYKNNINKTFKKLQFARMA